MALLLSLSSVSGAQRIALGTGIALPVGESRDIADAAQDLFATVVASTPLPAVSARVDVGWWRSLSHVIPNGIAQTVAVTAGANLSTGRIPFAYAIAGIGAYRSSMSRTPIVVNTTVDFGLMGGVGVRWAFRARLHLFAESRLHHILSDVSPTDYVDVTGGVSVSR